MPLAANHDRSEPIALTSRPRRAAGAPQAGGGSATAPVSKRRWNPPPADLFPPHVAPRVASRPPVPTAASSKHPREQFRDAVATAAATETHTSSSVKVSTARARKVLYGGRDPATKTAATQERSSCVEIPPIQESTRRLSHVTQTRLRRAGDEQQAAAAVEEPGAVQRETQSHGRRRDSLRSAHVLQSLRRQDVEPDDVRPLIEIAYWSPFIEVRRDAAAALASLSRNSANLQLLDDVGALGALLTMLSSSVDREDVGISRDCAQTLAALAQLPTTKTKLLQAPGGIDCVFSLLHAPSDHKLRLAGFEVVAQLVTTDDWREAVAKREGFVLMLNCCAGGGAPRSARGGGGGDTRIRSLAAAVLHQLALSRTNRQLFYHSGHFTALAGLLRDPFLDKDAVFRRELLSFIHLLLSEEENARRFTSLGLLPCVLAVLLGRSSSCASGLSHPVSLLVVAILEAVANDSANHEALVQAEALPRLVQLCFCPTTGMAVVGPGSGRPRTAAATGRRQPSQPKAPPVRPASATASAAHRRPPSASELLVSETNALVRAVLGIFCAMARNLANREPVIRSKVLDHIASRELYASPDKRVRRAVITLLTLLICFEREKRPASDQTSAQVDADAAGSSLHRPSCEPPDTSQSNHQHYIELLARGVVKCLFGILAGDDFSMKVDALAALAQLTQDTPSRLTLCKPALLLALQQFAFHPLATTRLHVAQIIANFAERPENVLKLVDAGLLAVLVRYVSRQGPGLRPSHSSDKATGDALLLETTRALAAVSMLHVARTRLVESGVLGSLLRLIRAPTSRAEVRSHALAVVCNLRHDAAALRIQAVFRGWHVRATQGSHLGCSRRTQPHRMLLILGQAAVASDTRPTTLRQQR